MLKLFGKGLFPISRFSTHIQFSTLMKEDLTTFELEEPSSTFPKHERFRKQSDSLTSVNFEGCSSPPNVYMGMSEKPLDQSIISILHVAPEDSEIQIKRFDGGLYMYQHFYQSLLNKAFGIGGWSIVPISKPTLFQIQDSTWCLIREFGLYCEGRFLAMGVGESMCYGFSQQRSGVLTAYEVSKRDALHSCCRDLGMTQQLIEEEFVNTWREKYAERIMCEHVSTKVNKFLWRKKGHDSAISYPWRPTSKFT